MHLTALSKCLTAASLAFSVANRTCESGSLSAIQPTVNLRLAHPWSPKRNPEDLYKIATDQQTLHDSLLGRMPDLPTRTNTQPCSQLASWKLEQSSVVPFSSTKRRYL